MVEHVGIKNLGGVLSEGARAPERQTGCSSCNGPASATCTSRSSPLSALRLRARGSDLGPLHEPLHLRGRGREPPALGHDARGRGRRASRSPTSRPMSAALRAHPARAGATAGSQNQAAVVAAYGERWFRLWRFFLHWSALIGEQGSAFTYQVLMHKNDNAFPRHSFRFGGLSAGLLSHCERAHTVPTRAGPSLPDAARRGADLAVVGPDVRDHERAVPGVPAAALAVSGPDLRAPTVRDPVQPLSPAPNRVSGKPHTSSPFYGSKCDEVAMA